MKEKIEKVEEMVEKVATEGMKKMPMKPIVTSNCTVRME